MDRIDMLKKDYAELLIRAGLNIQKGQRLVITCPVEGAEFARLCGLSRPSIYKYLKLISCN